MTIEGIKWRPSNLGSRFAAVRFDVRVLTVGLCWLMSLYLVGLIGGSRLAYGKNAFTEIKFFALDPGQYVGKTVSLRGTVRTSGPAFSWFILEDDTGKVLVTTVDSGVSLLCNPGSLAELEGKLTFLGEEHGLYFAMSRLLSCASGSFSPDRFFAHWMHTLLEN